MVLPTSAPHQMTADRRPSTATRRPPTAARRPSTAVCRPPSAARRLPDAARHPSPFLTNQNSLFYFSFSFKICINTLTFPLTEGGQSELNPQNKTNKTNIKEKP